MNVENYETIKDARRFITSAIEALDIEIAEAEKRIKDSIACKVPVNLWDRQSISIFQKEKETLEKTLKMLEALIIIKTDPIISSTIEDLVKGKSINWHRLSEEQRVILKDGIEAIEG